MACWFAGRKSEIVFDLEILDGSVLRDDCGQQLPKGRDAPLVVTQFVKGTALGFRRRRYEGAVEGPAGGHDAQRIVGHDERLADGIEDGFFERTTLLPAGHGIFPPTLAQVRDGIGDRLHVQGDEVGSR